MTKPTVLPLNSEMNAFHVQISVQGKDISFNMTNVPQGNKTSLKDVKIQGNTELRRLLLGLHHLVQQRLNENVTIEGFVMEIRDILESSAAECGFSLPPAEYYRKVYFEIDSLGWENVVSLSNGLSSASLRVFDERGREHFIEVTLPLEYPDKEPMISSELPIEFELQWSRESTMKDALKQFQNIVDKLQDFWNVMEDFDKSVWIMEPAYPSRASSYRRIALGGHCSLSLTINPLSPRSVPECRFFGPDMMVAPFRKQWNTCMTKWQVDKLPRENLEDILEITFPTPQDISHEDMSADCGICYTFRHPNAVDQDNEKGCMPDRVCDNPSCGRPFHSACLIEWLRSIKTTQQSFDILFGACPYCSHSIAVKLSFYD